MRVAALFSGGKDSTYALFCALQQGYEVKQLVTLEPEPDSPMFHHPNILLTKLQAKAIGIPHTLRTTTNERELDDLKDLLSKLAVDAVVSGAVERVPVAAHRCDMRTARAAELYTSLAQGAASASSGNGG